MGLLQIGNMPWQFSSIFHFSNLDVIITVLILVTSQISCVIADVASHFAMVCQSSISHLFLTTAPG